MGKKKSSKFIDKDNDPDNLRSNQLLDSEIPEEDTADDISPECHKCSIDLFMWEFGQNDTKRDSGSKMCRLGYSQVLRPGQTFTGIVLSSESNISISRDDTDIVSSHGIAGINCSWNRLDEIPFQKLGKARYHRKLPLLFAANSVNYGKPFKMNTAEATAAALYICGFIDDARILMSTFSYGLEFLRLNEDLLEQYRACSCSKEIEAVQKHYEEESKSFKDIKDRKRERGHPPAIDVV